MYYASVDTTLAAFPMDSSSAETTCAYTGLLNDTKYFWHVEAENAGGDTTSDSSSFVTKAAAIVNPTGGTTFDATRNESTFVEFSVTGYARVTVGIPSHNVHLVTDTVLLPEARHRFYWSGRDDDGMLVVPGQYSLQIFASFPTCDPESTLDVASYVGCVIKGTTVCGSESGNWTTSSDPYVLTGDVTIEHDTSLQIEPGVRVMTSGISRLTAEGNLTAFGTDSAPVYFGPYRKLAPIPDSAEPGSWQGIRIDDHTESHATLDHCIIEYAGDSGGVHNAGAAIVCKREAGLSLTNSVVRYSSTRGVRSNPNAPLTNTMLLRGDTFEYIADYPASVLAESVGSVVNSCTFRNNANPALDVHASTNHWVDQSAEWRCCEPGWRYDVDGYLYVHKTSWPSCCSLMVGPGATIRLGQHHKLEIGSSSAPSRTGYLGAWSQGERITFASLDTLDPDNWWEGIQLSENSQAWMESCYVNCSQGAALKGENDALLVPDYCEFRKSQCGLASAGAQVYATACRFVQNDTGMKFSGSASGPSYIMSCLVDGNTSFGLCALDDQEVRVYTTTFNNNNIPVRIRANLVYRPLLDSNYFPANTWHGIEIGSGNTTAGRIDDYACWTASPYISTYRCLGDLHVRNPSGDDGGVQPPIAPVPDFHYQDTKNTRAIGESGMNRQDAKNPEFNTKTQRHEEPGTGNREPGTDFTTKDTKNTRNPDFPLRQGWQGDWYHQGIPTPMEWARAHGVAENCVDSLLPDNPERAKTQDDGAEPQTGLGVRGQIGKHEAALPQAGGSRGAELQLGGSAGRSVHASRPGDKET
jgi:hypothetical protein